MNASTKSSNYVDASIIRVDISYIEERQTRRREQLRRRIGKLRDILQRSAKGDSTYFKKHQKVCRRIKLLKLTH